MKNRYKKMLICLLALVLSINFSAISYASGININEEISTTGYAPDNVCISPRAIIGTDDRFTVPNSMRSSYPYSAIGFLDLYFECGCDSHGTGFMVSKNCMLTAGHCLFCREHPYSQLSILRAYFGYTGSSYLISASANATDNVIYHDPNYVSFNSSSSYDYAYVVFNSNVGNTTGWFGMTAASDATLEGKAAIVCGFEGTALKSNSNYIDHVTSARIYYTIDTIGGQSGSPLYWGVNNNYTVAGIHITGSETINSAWRITSTFISRLRNLGYVD